MKLHLLFAVLIFTFNASLHDKRLLLVSRINQEIDSVVKNIQDCYILLDPRNRKVNFFFESLASFFNHFLHDSPRAYFFEVRLSHTKSIHSLFGLISSKQCESPSTVQHSIREIKSHLWNLFCILEDNEVYPSSNNLYIRKNEKGIQKDEMINNIAHGINLGNLNYEMFLSAMKDLKQEIHEQEVIDEIVSDDQFILENEEQMMDDMGGLMYQAYRSSDSKKEWDKKSGKERGIFDEDEGIMIS